MIFRILFCKQNTNYNEFIEFATSSKQLVRFI